ncbi:hypothetical protein [Cryobacterium cryoconiti]|uniref:Collagen-like protein n=1 Tax=Cryobacterium cryoconiti TaxID=1259239 RepID=A0A4Y8JSU5_9MICO|nr:hypothetical protein [Cryobacterium cryoconiti]TFD27533.1 hypothetical protein E3T49_13405 [Cryobacterium cryoconiti]
MMIRTERKWQIATGIVGMLTLSIFTAGAVYLGAANADLRSELTAARQDTRAATENANGLYQQLLTSGIEPEAEKPAEVIAGDTGKSGNDGAPGRPPTAEEVSSSVAAYCLIRLDCVGAAGPAGPVAPALIPLDGEDGADGTDGAAGADSTTPGPVGTTGADSTVPGPAGPSGPGITAVACQDDGDWLFTLTHPDTTTTTLTVAGPCRVEPITTPSEGATP